MMRNLVVLVVVCLFLVSCGNGNQKRAVAEVDDSITYIYYFHGKQRCKTCIAVENITEQTVAGSFSNDDKVQYVEVQTGEAKNESLIEKYEIGWNALIIAKGNEYVDITSDAFATAVNHPEKLQDLIIQTVGLMRE